MQSGFLRRRIGWLLCMVGMVMIFGALSYRELDKAHIASAETDVQRTLIIDPGHGGDDGGAVSDDGVMEADLNLEISRKLNLLSELCGIPTIMTRSGSEIAYPEDADTIAARKVADQKQRVARINAVANSVVISIHQNQYPSAAPHGAQVLYGRVSSSDELGKAMQELLVKHIDPQNRRVAAPISEEIYLFQNISCPAVLVECGFLSNAEECSRLQDGAYQAKLALTILSAYLQYSQNGCQI